MVPKDWFKEASDFDYEYSIEAKKYIFSLFTPMLRPKANMNIYFYINHIAICMCNSLKWWFKHPLP